MVDSWLSGNPYEVFMGRWSSLIAHKFLGWLAIPPSHSWVDVSVGLCLLILVGNPFQGA
jgi:hypothetical protein